jgi:hypothetical protein
MSSCWVDLLPELLPLIRARAQQLDMRTRMRLRLVCRAWLAADPKTYFSVTSTHAALEKKELTFVIREDASWITEVTYMNTLEYTGLGSHGSSLAILFTWLSTGPACFCVKGGTWNQLRDVVYAIPFMYDTQFRRRGPVSPETWQPRNYGDAFAIWGKWNEEEEYWERQDGKLIVLEQLSTAHVTFAAY